MKIRWQLLSLFAFTLLSMAGIIGSYLAMVNRIESINAERKILVVAGQASDRLRLNFERFGTDAFIPTRADFQKAREDYKNALGAVATLKVIPTLGPSMAKAVDDIAKLQTYSDAVLAEFDTALSTMETDIKTAMGGANDSDLMMTLMMLPSLDEAAKSTFSAHLFNYRAVSSKLRTSFELGSKIYNEQNSAIGVELDRIEAAKLVAPIIVTVLAVAFITLMTLFIARSLASAMGKISQGIEVVADGNLSIRFGLKRKDEVGDLSRNVDSLLTRMSQSIGEVKQSSHANLKYADQLQNIVQEATSSAVQIEANSGSIKDQLVGMDKMIQGSDKQLSLVADSLDSFNAKVSAQNKHIEESVATITQTLTTLENISRLTEADRESASDLVLEADQGRSIFEESFAKIDQISESIGAIQDMASVIANIASQTAILAMNAAIEAAHAGESGKGFAVVADEISKLAEASASSSEEIAQTISQITVSMSDAVSNRENTAHSFEAISTKISHVSASVSEIYSNISEMQSGSNQLLSSLQNLRNASADITHEAATINQNTSSVAVVFRDVSRVSNEVSSNIAEINIGLRDINQAIRQVSELSGKVEESGTTLDKSIAFFKVEA